MATFARPTFAYGNYASARPSYPAVLYDMILRFHRGPREVALDLGTGHGLVARSLSPRLTKIVGIDPSEGMLHQAKTLTSAEEYANVSYRQSSAEALPFLENNSVDLVTAAQAAHWFDQWKLWPELKRVVRREGIVAFWAYGGPVPVHHANATRLIRHLMYGKGENELGTHWPQPGARLVQGRLRELPVPQEAWLVLRHEYEPDRNGHGQHQGEGQCWMERTSTVAGLTGLLRSHSSYFNWCTAHPQHEARKDGGDGDCVDWCMDQIVQEEGQDWKDDDFTFPVEHSTGLILARKL